MREQDTHELEQEEQHEAEERTSVSAKVILEAIRRDGEEELDRSSSALAWSAVAAGLAMGLSLLAEGVIRSHLPDVPWRPLVAKLGYPLGFVIVITGKQQLFTENTLTPIIPLLHNRNGETLLHVLRLWIVVLTANLVGTLLIAWFLACSPVLTTNFQHSLFETAREATSADPWTAFVRGIPAGWLIALVVWLRAGAESGKLAVLIILTYFIALPGFTHVVAGSVEYLYLVMAGQASALSFVGNYFLPVLAGNILGGMAIVAGLNHGQVKTDD